MGKDDRCEVSKINMDFEKIKKYLYKRINSNLEGIRKGGRL